MAFGYLDRLPAEVRGSWQPSAELYFCPVHQAHELEVRPLDPARYRHGLVQVALRVVEAADPGLGIADLEQRQRTQLFPARRGMT